MKSVNMACVHPAALQLFQKLWESMLGSGSEGGSTGCGGEETQMVSVGALEMDELVQGGEPGGLRGLDWSAEGGEPVELCCGTEGPAVC